jgi:hypothetical protein
VSAAYTLPDMVAKRPAFTRGEPRARCAQSVRVVEVHGEDPEANYSTGNSRAICSPPAHRPFSRPA